jgi:hypothetical protein
MNSSVHPGEFQLSAILWLGAVGVFLVPLLRVIVFSINYLVEHMAEWNPIGLFAHCTGCRECFSIMYISYMATVKVHVCLSI